MPEMECPSGCDEKGRGRLSPALVTRDVLPPVAHVGVHTPVEAGVALSPMRGALGTLVVHGAAVLGREVSFRLRTRELDTPPGAAQSSVLLLLGLAPVVPGDLHQPEQCSGPGSLLDCGGY